MTVQKALITSYYLVLIGFVSLKVVDVVYKGSLVIAQGATAQQMQHHKDSLLAEKYELEQDLHHRSSITSLADSQLLTEYEPITSPIILQVPSTVASR